MQPKTLKVLGGAFVVLATAWGLTILASRRPPPKERLLWEKAPDAKKLVIGEATLLKAADGWALDKPFHAKADRAKVEDFLGKLAKVTLSEAVSSDPGRHEYFMVTTSSGIRLQGYTDDKATSPALDVLAGKSGADYDSLLLRPSGGNDVLEGKGLSRYDIEQGASRWADRTLAKLDAASIRAVEVRLSTETVRLKRDGGGWRLDDAGVALSSAVVSRLVEPILSKLGGLEADEVLPETAASSPTLIGLRSPELRISVRYADSVASGVAKALEKRLELAVAAKGNDSRCAVRKSGDSLLYMVSNWQLDAFRKKRSEFR